MNRFTRLAGWAVDTLELGVGAGGKLVRMLEDTVWLVLCEEGEEEGFVMVDTVLCELVFAAQAACKQPASVRVAVSKRMV